MTEPKTNNTAGHLKWSIAGLLTLFVVPMVAYLIGVSIAPDLTAARASSPDVMTVGYALASFMLRIGAMVHLAVSVARVLFWGPNASTPRWMIRRG